MQPKQNILIAFLQELLQRFFTKSPKFFKIWQLISAILIAVTGLPDFLHLFGVVLPDQWMFFANKAVAAASSGVLFMSLLTTQSKVLGTDQAGNVIKETSKSLPYTSINETKNL